jgi:chorismate dehydratase
MVALMLNCDLEDTSASPAMNGPLRVCAVSYLNTLPLVWGMLHGPQKGLFELSFALPSECADRLASGVADIGIVPTAELARLDLSIIPGAGIACDGPVRSILLVSRVPVAEITTIATDSSSRTSVTLARVLLSRKYGIEPVLKSMPPDLPSMLEAADAALIIGDPALHLDPATIPFHTLDLGAEWKDLTGLPMVFAVWAARKAIVDASLEAAFLDSCRFGLKHISEIASTAFAERAIDRQLAFDYLTHHIVFTLGEREYRGMTLFLQYAAELRSLAPIGDMTV